MRGAPTNDGDSRPTIYEITHFGFFGYTRGIVRNSWGFAPRPDGFYAILVQQFMKSHTFAFLALPRENGQTCTITKRNIFFVVIQKNRYRRYINRIGLSHSGGAGMVLLIQRVPLRKESFDRSLSSSQYFFSKTSKIRVFRKVRFTRQTDYILLRDRGVFVISHTLAFSATRGE